MKTYQAFANALETLLGSDQAVRLTVEGYMPLSVERIGRSGDGRPLVAISHTAVQNGDLMRDPELVFELFDAPGPGPETARPITRAAWNATHRDYRGCIDGQPAVLELDERGATVLAPVRIVDVIAEPITFRNDFVGVLQDVYSYDDEGRRTHVRPRRKAELKSFARMWFRNLRAQGFLGSSAHREVLA